MKYQNNIRYCPSCGGELKNTYKDCPYCGINLVGYNANDNAVVNIDDAKKDIDNITRAGKRINAKKENELEQKGRKDKKLFMIASLCVVVFIIVALLMSDIPNNIAKKLELNSKIKTEIEIRKDFENFTEPAVELVFKDSVGEEKTTDSDKYCYAAMSFNKETSETIVDFKYEDGYLENDCFLKVIYEKPFVFQPKIDCCAHGFGFNVNRVEHKFEFCRKYDDSIYTVDDFIINEEFDNKSIITKEKLIDVKTDVDKLNISVYKKENISSSWDSTEIIAVAKLSKDVFMKYKIESLNSEKMTDILENIESYMNISCRVIEKEGGVVVEK